MFFPCFSTSLMKPRLIFASKGKLFLCPSLCFADLFDALANRCHATPHPVC